MTYQNWTNVKKCSTYTYVIPHRKTIKHFFFGKFKKTPWKCIVLYVRRGLWSFEMKFSGRIHGYLSGNIRSLGRGEIFGNIRVGNDEKGKNRFDWDNIVDNDYQLRLCSSIVLLVSKATEFVEIEENWKFSGWQVPWGKIFGNMRVGNDEKGKNSFEWDNIVDNVYQLCFRSSIVLLVSKATEFVEIDRGKLKLFKEWQVPFQTQF